MPLDLHPTGNARQVDTRQPPLPKCLALELANSLSHELLDFGTRCRGSLLEGVDLNNPDAVQQFVELTDNNAVSHTLAELSKGTLMQLFSLLQVIVEKKHPNSASQNTSKSPVHTNQSHSTQTKISTNPPRYLQVPKKNLHTEEAPADRFPKLDPGLNPDERRLDYHAFKLSHKATKTDIKAARRLVGYEEKSLALFTTNLAEPPLKSPRNLPFLLSRGGFSAQCTVVSTHDARKLLICAPKSSLQLFQDAYDRMRESLRHQGFLHLPKAQVSVQPEDLRSMCSDSNTTDLKQLIVGFRKEIGRLESPENPWRPRWFFAKYLRSIEQELHTNYVELGEVMPALAEPVDRKKEKPPTPTSLLSNPSEPQRLRAEEKQEALVPPTLPNKTEPQQLLPPSNDNAMEITVESSQVETRDDVAPTAPDLQPPVHPMTGNITAYYMSPYPTNGPCPPLSLVLNTPIPTIRYIPCTIRSQVLSLYFYLLRSINMASNETARSSAITRLLITPKLVLRLNGRGEPRSRNSNSRNAKVASRISRAIRGEWDCLYEEAIDAHLSSPRAPTASPPDATLRRSRKAFNSGEIGRAASGLAQSTAPAPPTVSNHEKLVELHPAPTTPVQNIQANNVPPALHISEQQCQKALARLPQGSGCGPDGLYPSHLRTLARRPGGEPPNLPLLTEVTKFVNLCLKGGLPQWANPLFASSTIIGISELDSVKLRPLATRLAWRRLVARIAAGILSVSE